jgi:hypothetical protein
MIAKVIMSIDGKRREGEKIRQVADPYSSEFKRLRFRSISLIL